MVEGPPLVEGVPIVVGLAIQESGGTAIQESGVRPFKKAGTDVHTTGYRRAPPMGYRTNPPVVQQWIPVVQQWIPVVQQWETRGPAVDTRGPAVGGNPVGGADPCRTWCVSPHRGVCRVHRVPTTVRRSVTCTSVPHVPPVESAHWAGDRKVAFSCTGVWNPPKRVCISTKLEH